MKLTNAMYAYIQAQRALFDSSAHIVTCQTEDELEAQFEAIRHHFNKLSEAKTKYENSLISPITCKN